MANYKVLAASLGLASVILLGAFVYEFSLYTGEVASANSLSTQVNSMQGQLNSALGKISNLTSELTSAQVAIGTLNSQESSSRSNFSSQISLLQGQLSSATKDIANLTSQLDSAQSNIATLTSQVTSLQTRIHQDETTIAVLLADIKAILGPPTISQASTNYCVVSLTCQTSLYAPVPVGNLIVASGGCPGPFVSFSDSLGNNFTVDATASIVNGGVTIGEVATVHGVSRNGTALDNITLTCGTSGTIGLQVLTITGILGPFATATGAGRCLSGCSQFLSTTPVKFNASRNYVAVGAVWAYPGCSCSSAGPGFTIIISHDNKLIASEFATAVSSPTTFPLTDGNLPNQWLDIGVVFVGAL